MTHCLCIFCPSLKKPADFSFTEEDGDDGEDEDDGEGEEDEDDDSDAGEFDLSRNSSFHYVTRVHTLTLLLFSLVEHADTPQAQMTTMTTMMMMETE